MGEIMGKMHPRPGRARPGRRGEGIQMTQGGLKDDGAATIDRRRLLQATSLLGIAGLPAAALAQAGGPAAAGLVTDLRGDAMAQRNEARRRLSADGPVFVGDRVETGDGARAGFRLGRATELRLGENARITIDRFIVDAGGTITLGAGALLVDKPPGSETGRIRVRSSYGLIAVRGTRFFAGPSNGVFGVFVARGEVAVRAGGREVVLTSGEGTDIASRGAPPTPARAWGEARIRDALAQIA
jgi:hypothetical protein